MLEASRGNLWPRRATGWLQRLPKAEASSGHGSEPDGVIAPTPDAEGSKDCTVDNAWKFAGDRTEASESTEGKAMAAVSKRGGCDRGRGADGSPPLCCAAVGGTS